VHALDPVHELVPQDLLPQRPRRAVPYLYTDAEIRALMDASCVIPTPHRAATMGALVGLLAVTGMRIGEAIRLDQDDIDHQRGTLTVVETKFGKSRQLAVDATTTAALRAYLGRSDRPVPAKPTEAVFTSAVGTRLTYCNVHLAFKRIVAHAVLVARSTVCRPRPHDLRHTFAVKRAACRLPPRPRRRRAHPGPDADYRNWRTRVFQPTAAAVGLATLSRRVAYVTVDGKRRRRVTSRYTGPRPYDLRHTAASLLLRDPSYSLPEVAAFLGHDVATLSTHYAHIIAELRGRPPVSVSEAIGEARAGRTRGETPPKRPQLRGEER
jgi:integrase